MAWWPQFHDVMTRPIPFRAGLVVGKGTTIYRNGKTFEEKGFGLEGKCEGDGQKCEGDVTLNNSPSHRQTLCTSGFRKKMLACEGEMNNE